MTATVEPLEDHRHWELSLGYKNSCVCRLLWVCVEAWGQPWVSASCLSRSVRLDWPVNSVVLSVSPALRLQMFATTLDMVSVCMVNSGHYACGTSTLATALSPQTSFCFLRQGLPCGPGFGGNHCVVQSGFWSTVSCLLLPLPGVTGESLCPAQQVSF